MKLIEIENCKVGYILKGFVNHKNKGHYIIFIKSYHFPDFIGAMISTKNFENKNVLMSENHFNERRIGLKIVGNIDLNKFEPKRNQRKFVSKPIEKQNVEIENLKSR